MIASTSGLAETHDSDFMDLPILIWVPKSPDSRKVFTFSTPTAPITASSDVKAESSDGGFFLRTIIIGSSPWLKRFAKAKIPQNTYNTVDLVIVLRHKGFRLIPPTQPYKHLATELVYEESAKKPKERSTRLRISEEVYDRFKSKVEERYGRHRMVGYVVERLMQKYADGEVDIGI
jgi:hypothetical protein